MARKSRNTGRTRLVIELVTAILCWIGFLGMMLKQEDTVGILIGIFVFGIMGWGVGANYMSQQVRNVVLILLGIASALFLFPVAAKWGWIVGAAGMMVFVIVIWEFVPRYYHGRRMDHKERRNRIPLWQDFVAFGGMAALMMELGFLIG